MAATHTLVILVLGTVLSADSGESVALQPRSPRFTVDVPSVVLTGVPVSRIVITARDADGNRDTSFGGRPLIQGIKLSVAGDDTALPRFEMGVLELTTDLAADRKVYVIADEIVVAPESHDRSSLTIRRIPSWLSVVPPLIAIALAIWLQNVVASLFVGVWCGSVILAHWNIILGSLRSLDNYLLDELVQSGRSDKSHMMIVLFTIFLGSMVGVMARSGGTHAMVARLARFTQTREHTQLLTWALGLVVFFDDYANTLMVGSTMRPVTDRLRISREKLSFLVDSTSAPVAGLAIISTWVGVEIGYIADTYDTLGLSGDVYSTFLSSIPYRFYPLQLLAFVWLIAYTGHDFGPMLRAEARALAFGQLNRPEASVPEDEPESIDEAKPFYLRNAVAPLVTLLVLTLLGLWWSGMNGLAHTNLQRVHDGQPQIPITMWTLLNGANPNRVLFMSSFAASVVACAMAVASRSLTLNQSIDAWLEGARSMLLAIVILVTAWGIATLCDENHLNTAGFLIEITQGKLRVAWLPSLAFLLSAAVSFATGSSWSTMGLLMPVSLSMTYHLLLNVNEGGNPVHPMLLATCGAVLAGAIFGDHCSPISDTTILSSAASRADHLAHVRTQMPYALTVAAVSLFMGYIPVGFGYSPIVLLPLGLIVLYLVVQFIGQPPDVYAQRMSERAAAEDRQQINTKMLAVEDEHRRNG